MIPFDKAETEGTFAERFRRVVKAVPERSAIRAPDAALTYGELDSGSEAVTRAILRVRGPSEEPVGVLLEHGAACLRTLVGILKAGKSFLLLPPDGPPARLAAVHRDARNPLIVTDRKHRGLARSLAGPAGAWMDLNEQPPGQGNPPPGRTGPDSLAAIFYTSGSTGEPKGVMWSHRLVLHTAWHNRGRYRIGETDRIAILSAFGFGAAMTMEFAALLNGACILLPTGREHSLTALTDWLRREAATILSITSLGMFRQQRRLMAARADLPALRLLLIGGEEMYRKDVESFRTFLPARTEIAYRLAGSETMLIRELRLSADTDIPEEKLTVGYAVPDKEVMLLDDQGNETPCGEVGEITVRSRYLASGYWGDPERTRRTFPPPSEEGGQRICRTGDMGRMTPDDRLEYFGRRDNMVKVRGFRIQLEDVEAAVNGVPGIQDAAVVAADVPTGGKRLIAYLVPATKTAPSIEAVRRGLIGILPSHMIPTKYLFLESLPRTAAGKIDRPRLPSPGPGRPDLGTPYAPPRNGVERRLCAIWTDALKLTPVGIHDDFFLLGGDSLTALHMLLAVEEAFAKPVPPAFFAAPTIARLSESWRNAPAGPGRGARPDAPSPYPGNKTPIGKDRWKHFEYRSAEAGLLSLDRHARLTRIAAQRLSLHLDYPSACRWLTWWCSRAWIVERFYRGEQALFHMWKRHLGLPAEPSPDTLAAALTSNIMWSRRFKEQLTLYPVRDFIVSLRQSSARIFRTLARLIENAPDRRFDRFFSFEGLEHLESARRRKQGVILVSYHNSTNRFAIAALPRRIGGDPIPTLSLPYARSLPRAKKGDQSQRRAALLADAAVNAHHLLEGGAVLQIIPDLGYDAADGLPVDIAGYRFLIKPGFSELALLSGAAVIPQYSTRQKGGRIHLRIGPPFEPVDPGQGRPARIASLLEQYAAFVEDAWRKAPESLLWPVIDTHLQRPKADH